MLRVILTDVRASAGSVVLPSPIGAGLLEEAFVVEAADGGAGLLGVVGADIGAGAAD